VSRIFLYLRRALWAACVLFVAAYGLALTYALPRTQILRLSGTDVATTSTEVANALSFVHAVDRHGRSLVFRNEDTGWGFPPYFFKRSSEVAKEASRLASSNNRWVALMYYGFRVPLMGAYPNVVGIESASRAAEPQAPWFNIVFLLAHPIVGGYLAWKWVRWRKPALEHVSGAEPTPAAACPGADSSAQGSPGPGVSPETSQL